MRITIYAVPGSDFAGTAVGYAGGSVGLGNLTGKPPRDGKILSYVGRAPHIDGVEVEHADIAEDLYEAIEAAGKRVFGPEWVAPLGHVSGMNVRSLQRGRVLSHGLPLPLLVLLGRAIATKTPRAVGHLMQAVAWSWDEHQTEHEVEPGRMSTSGREALAARLDALMAQSLDLVGAMRDAGAVAKIQRQASRTETKD